MIKVSLDAKIIMQLKKFSGASFVVLYHGQLYTWLELEISRKDIAHNVVMVSPLDQAFSLLACVYGGPAMFVTTGCIFHESPYRSIPHWHWALVRED